MKLDPAKTMRTLHGSLTDTYDTAILFLVFNRLDTAKLVFNIIRDLKPQRFYIASDGPRENRQGEAEKVEEVRGFLLKSIDWPCEIHTLFREKNLGCQIAVGEAITWFFETEEMGIILEDDCLPNISFWEYCSDLLKKYKDDQRIMAVSGNNFQKKIRSENSYYFSRYPHCWGWATWKRAWDHYDFWMSNWPEIDRGAWLEDIFYGESKAVGYWRDLFKGVFEGRINSWAYRWQYSCWLQNGLCILPNVNLVSNYGFGEDSTHTSKEDEQLSRLEKYDLELPLKHPPFIIRDAKSDQYTQSKIYQRPLKDKLIHKILDKTNVKR